MIRNIILWSIGLFIANSSLAQTVATSVETRINSTTANTQQHPATAMDASGNFIVVWESFEQDGSGYGVYAQRYNADGTVNGAEFTPATTIVNDQRFPDVAMDKDGNFVIVWQCMACDGDGWGIYKRQYDNTGTAITGQGRVNSAAAGQERFPSVAMDGAGNFVVVYDNDQDIYSATYLANGTKTQADFLINTTTSNMQSYPDIAMDHDGNYTVVWQSLDQDGADYGIYAQRLDNNHSTVGPETRINSTTSNSQLSPAIAMDSLGNYAVVWVSNSQDGDAEGIYMQMYDNTGTAVGTEVQVNTTTAGAQDNPDIGMTEDGEILVAWNSYAQDGSRFGVYQQAFYFDGGTSTAWGHTSVETLVNSTTTDFQQFPAIAMRHQQNGVVVWQDGERISTSSQDGDDYGIYMQLYTVPGGTDLPVELLVFDAQRKDANTVNLSWITESETNNKGFFVERMLEIEGQFETIAWVDGKGTTTTQNGYELSDPNSFTGVSYYRLRQVDFDESFSYSAIRAVSGIENNTFIDVSIFPNPVQELLNIRFNELKEDVTTADIQILSTSGQLLHQFNTDITAYQVLGIDFVSQLTPAMYLISIELNNGDKVLQKFVKQD